MFHIGESEVDRLKRKARSAYQSMLSIGDTMDCGHALALVISRDYSAASTRFNEAWARLRELDPDCPPAPAWTQAVPA